MKCSHTWIVEYYLCLDMHNIIMEFEVYLQEGLNLVWPGKLGSLCSVCVKRKVN